MVCIRSFLDILAVLRWRLLKIPMPAPPHLMVIQKESELRVHQHGWADLPVPDSSKFCSPVHGRWLAHIFRETYYAM